MKRLKLNKNIQGRYIIKFIGFITYCNIFDSVGTIALIYENNNKNNFC